jgi:nuclear pore complex protein Nup160
MSSNLLDLISVNYFYDGIPKYFQHIISVFEQVRAFAHVADFAHLALQALDATSETDGEYESIRTDLMSRLFHASLKTCRFDEAFSAFLQFSDGALQKSAITSLISTILTASGSGNAGLQKILHFPLSLNGSLCSHVDIVLASLAKRQLKAPSTLGQAIPVYGWQDPANIPNYNRILQAFRIARNDFRGAAEIAYKRVAHLRDVRDQPHSFRKQFNAPLHPDQEDDLESKELRNELLVLINLLACMEKSEAYIVVEQPDRSVRSRPGTSDSRANGNDPDKPLGDSVRSRRDSTGSQGAPRAQPLKRVIITLDDLRREYQAELDRVSRIERGDWEFGVVRAGGEDSDDEDGMGIVGKQNGVQLDGDVVMGGH